MSSEQVPNGFEAAHVEWLLIGGQSFRVRHRPGPRQDFYRTQYWKLVKQAVLESRGFTCCRCRGEANQVHHLNYEFVGEDHLHPEVLVAICRPCHGLIEYARKSESIISRIRRRISLCKGFLGDARGCHDQNAEHIYARLLEYRDELAKLRNLFLTKTHYRNPRINSRAESEALVARFRQEELAYEEQAANEVPTWDGSEKEKAEWLLPMLELEMQNCRKFVAEVFEPVPPRAGEPPSGVEDQESAAPGVESLVVGIKYHRGHVDGIAQGDSVQLMREPNNGYDPNAIQVSLQTGETLGYLTREFAATLAKQMDAGMCVQAQVSGVVRDKVYVEVIVGGTDS